MEQKVKKRGWVKDAAIIFLAVMLVLTFFSNTIMNRSLPEVATSYVMGGSIDSKVRVSGTVTAKENYDVILEQSRKVERVLVKAGQEVATGDVLFTLEPGDSDELAMAQSELKNLKLSYQRMLINATQADYAMENRSITQAREALEKAQAKCEELAQDETAYKNAQEAVDVYTAEVKVCSKNVETAQTGVNNSSDSVFNDPGYGAANAVTQAQTARDQALLVLNHAKEYPEYKALENEAKTKILNDYNADHPADTKAAFSELPQAEQNKLRLVLDDVAQQYAPADAPDTATYAEAYAKIAAAQKSYNEAVRAAEQAEAAYADSVTETNRVARDQTATARDSARQTLDAIRSFYAEQYAALEELAKQRLLTEYGDESVTEFAALPAEEQAKLGDYIQLIAESGTLPVPQNTDPKYAAYLNFVEKEAALAAAEAALASAQASLNDQSTYIPGTDYDGKTHAYWVAQLKDAQEKLTKAQERLAECTELFEKLKQQKADYEAAQAEVQQYENALDELLFNLEQQKKADGKAQQLEALDRQEMQDQIAEAQARVDELSGGDTAVEVKSRVNGTVQSISVSAGHTANAGEVLAVIEVPDLGYTLTATVSSDQARLLHVGDTAAVNNFYWGSSTTAELTKMQPDPKNPQANRILTFDITGNVTVGSTLNFSVGEKNANYDYVVPNSALRSDTNGSFLLIVTAKNSPLGNRYYATRVDVEVLASDDLNSAVNGALEGYESVITTTAKNAPIANGDQVRLSDTN